MPPLKKSNPKVAFSRCAPEPIANSGEYLRFVSEQWDQALARLKSFVES